MCIRDSFYDDPSRALSLVGVTGTNGKTTTTYLVEHIARVAGKRTGVIGTVGTVIGDEHEKASHTTPESPDLQHLLARMRDARCDVVAMEASSHALDLEPVSYTHLDVYKRQVEMIELPDHPWFVASQGHPEFKSRPTRPHPLFRDFVAAALEHRG